MVYSFSAQDVKNERLSHRFEKTEALTGHSPEILPLLACAPAAPWVWLVMEGLAY
jgi:hypothetical protein